MSQTGPPIVDLSNFEERKEEITKELMKAATTIGARPSPSLDVCRLTRAFGRLGHLRGFRASPGLKECRQRILLIPCPSGYTLLPTLSQLTIDTGLVIHLPCSAWQAICRRSCMQKTHQLRM